MNPIGTETFLLLYHQYNYYYNINEIIIYSFHMHSKLNELITNICCNSESCLPTNKMTELIFTIFHRRDV